MKKITLMKKAALMFLCIIVLGVMLPLNASADMGPKPSVIIDFQRLEGKTYYATLLSNEISTGPHTALEGFTTGGARYTEGDKDYNIYKKFADYTDADGFYFLQFFEDCSQTNRFIWGYFPPQEFKVLLYFTETDSFIVSSESYTRYAFNSYFTAKITQQGLGLTAKTDISLAKSYDYADEALSLLARVLLTIAIELLIALLFGIRRKRAFIFIAVVNIITQVILNVTLNIANYFMGSMVFTGCYILLELAVFAIEAMVYMKYLQNKYSKRKLVLYALIANAASFTLGLLLAIHIPGIF